MGDNDTGTTSRQYDRPRNGGERWYDPNRTVIALLSVVMVLFLSWGGWVTTTARASEVVNIEQEQKIQSIEKALEKQFQKHDEKLDRLDLKIERFLEKAK